MKINWKTLTVLALLTLTSCGNSSNSNSSSTEPILVDDSELAKYDELRDFYNNSMSLPNIVSNDAPDPFILRYNGTYYLYMTTSGNRIRCYESKDMLNWEPAVGGPSDGICYDYNTDTGHPASGTPYAPEVMYFNGKFYLVTSPAGNGHYILESDYPYGPYTAITGNFGASIDGSFFMDSNEDIYLYTAASGPTAVYMLNDDMTLMENDDGSIYHSSYLEANLGAWDEGPFMIQRNGAYYFTWCGTHYLSDCYRVDYCYAEPGSDISRSSSLKRQGTLAISTDPEFYGLGHSCCVLGPDLDSEYLVYHDLQLNRRNLNFSRLSFDGSKMIVNDLKRDDNFVPATAEFNAYSLEDFNEDGNYFLSDTASEGNQFTAEFNVIGEGKMIFSYVDDSNYSYIEFINNIITVNTVEAGNKREISRTPLIREYDTEVNHTFRISYKSGLYNLYFDQMEKAYGMPATFKAGKIGIESNNQFYDVGYCGLSSVGKGGSDAKEYNSKRILANAYDERLSYLTGTSGLKEVTSSGEFIATGSHNMSLERPGDRATYRVYTPFSNDYHIFLRIPSCHTKNIGVRIDDGDIIECCAVEGGVKPRFKSGDMVVDLGSISINEGQHNISICNIGDEFAFSELELYEHDEESLDFLTFDSSTNLNDYFTRNELTITDQGIRTAVDMYNFITTKEEFTNGHVEANIKVNELSEDSYIGLMVNINDNSHRLYNDGEYRNGNNDTTYRGMLFSIEKSGQVIIRNMDYNFSKTIMAGEYEITAGEEYFLEVEQISNRFIFRVNDVVVADFYANVSMMHGQAGICTYMADCYLTQFGVEARARTLG